MSRPKRTPLDRFMDEFLNMSDAEMAITIQQLTWTRETAARIRNKSAAATPAPTEQTLDLVEQGER